MKSNETVFVELNLNWMSESFILSILGSNSQLISPPDTPNYSPSSSRMRYDPTSSSSSMSTLRSSRSQSMMDQLSKDEIVVYAATEEDVAMYSERISLHHVLIRSPLLNSNISSPESSSSSFSSSSSVTDLSLQLIPLAIELERERSSVMIIASQHVIKYLIGYFCSTSLRDIRDRVVVPSNSLIQLTPSPHHTAIDLIPLRDLDGEDEAKRDDVLSIIRESSDEEKIVVKINQLKRVDEEEDEMVLQEDQVEVEGEEEKEIGLPLSDNEN